MNKFFFNKLPKGITLEGIFDDNCFLMVSDEAMASVNEHKLVIRIVHYGKKPIISNFSACIESTSGVIVINVGGDGTDLYFHSGSLGNFDLRLWENSKVVIGKNTTSNNARIVCANSGFVCGEDCMFSGPILIQTSDQHGIVDLATGRITNSHYRTVNIDDHVWLGRGCTLTPNAYVGSGSIIATGAIVTGGIPKNVIAGGVPARVIKENQTWTRQPDEFDLYSRMSIEKYFKSEVV